MGLRRKKDDSPQITKKHCGACNGVGNVQKTDYTQKPNSTGSYPTVEARCQPCNGQGWTAA